MRRYLIINADDFGLSSGTNAGIIESHERGIVTSASLMVRQPAASEGADYARKNLTLSVGLHVDLGEWTMRDGDWTQAYVVVPHDDSEAVARELARQLDEFRRLMQREPTHLDSHQHIHRTEPLRSALRAVAESLRVPVRDFTPAITYCGDFYGQGKECAPFPEGIGFENLLAIFQQLTRNHRTRLSSRLRRRFGFRLLRRTADRGGDALRSPIARGSESSGYCDSFLRRSLRNGTRGQL